MKAKKATIKKPKFLLPYFISVIILLAAFLAAAVIMIMPTYYEYNFNMLESATSHE